MGVNIYLAAFFCVKKVFIIISLGWSSGRIGWKEGGDATSEQGKRMREGWGCINIADTGGVLN